MFSFFSRPPPLTWSRTPLNNLSNRLGIPLKRKLKNTNVYETENGRYIRANGTYVTQPPPQRNTPQTRPSTVSKTKYQELINRSEEIRGNPSIRIVNTKTLLKYGNKNRITREFETIQKLRKKIKRPHFITKVIRLYTNGNQAAFTMEKISGKTLEQYKLKNRISPNIQKTINGHLRKLKNAGYTHPDLHIHNRNIIIGDDGQIYIIDFE